MKKLTRPILIVGTSQECPDIEYLTGFKAPDPVVLLKKGKQCYLVVPRLELGRAERAGKHVLALTPDTLRIRSRKKGSVGEWAMKLLKQMGVRSVTVPRTFPYGVAKRLQQGGVRIFLAKRGICPERAVKSKEEQRNIMECQQAAVIAMRAATAAIGSTTIDDTGLLRANGKILWAEDVRAIITKVLLDHNCFCREAIVAGGPQAAEPHEKGTGPLRASEAIVIDIFPQHLSHGYWGDITRTVVKGPPNTMLRKMYHAVKAAQSAALNQVRPGVKTATVHRSAVQEFTRRGFTTRISDAGNEGFTHGTGHGVGLNIHEAPSVSLGDARLRTGNVITIEPGLYYADTGGIRIEDTIVVTPGGWKYLVPCEKRFELQ